MSGARIEYSNIAPQAKQDFVPSCDDSAFNTLTNAQIEGLKSPNYANPCELYQTPLDGSAVPVPTNTSTTQTVLWSKQTTDENGEFLFVVELELRSKGLYSSPGITFVFDEHNNIYPRSIQIEWRRTTDNEDIELYAQSYVVTSPTYFCSAAVEAYNRVIVRFFNLNMPYNRLKVQTIDYGYERIFEGGELKNVKITRALDPISSEIKINTCDFTILTQTSENFNFQSKQPVMVTFDNDLIIKSFVKTAKRNTKHSWDITTEDYFGLMDRAAFVGGIYNNILASDILEAIFTAAVIPYSVETDITDVRLSGYIPYTTCREALMQVCFAAGLVADTSRSEVVKIKAISGEIAQTIPLNRIMQGQTVTDNDPVTGVELTCHAYTAITDDTEAYKAEESGIGESILVKFSEPLHDLSIVNGAILTGDTNYAIIDAQEGCILTGRKYEHKEAIRRRLREGIASDTTENISSVSAAYLISPSNVDTALTRCYNWLIGTTTTSFRVIEGKSEVRGMGTKYGEGIYGQFKYGALPSAIVKDPVSSVGDKVTVETEFMGNITGIITNQSFNLNGGIIVKDTELSEVTA